MRLTVSFLILSLDHPVRHAAWRVDNCWVTMFLARSHIDLINMLQGRFYASFYRAGHGKTYELWVVHGGNLSAHPGFFLMAG